MKKTKSIVKPPDEGVSVPEKELKRTVVQRELKRLMSGEEPLTPELILEAARSKSNPLHGFFQWDNGKAGESYRLMQARELIRVVRILKVLDDGRKQEPVSVRALINVNPGKGFVTRSDAVDNAAIRSAMVDRHIRTLEAWIRETVDLPELAAVRMVIVGQLDRWSRFRQPKKAG